MQARQLFFVSFSDFFLSLVEIFFFVASAVADRLAAAIVSEAVAAIVSTCLKCDLEILLKETVKHSDYGTYGNDSAYNDKQTFESVGAFLVFTVIHKFLLSPSGTE